jgi:Ham1 family protein
MTIHHRINYVTSSTWKQEENKEFVEHCALQDGTPVRDLFRFTFRPLEVPERLLVSIEDMVRAEVTYAYEQIKVPCIVEHAGLIFLDHSDRSYPGGLTKPMWNVLGPDFVRETGSAGREVIARAVVAYCDGRKVRTFIGETTGSLAPEPRGRRSFYWDNVFIPHDVVTEAVGLTYSEIVDVPSLGLRYKVASLSQSSRAMLKFLDYLREAGTAELWR